MKADPKKEVASRSPVCAFMCPHSLGQAVVASLWYVVLAVLVHGILCPIWNIEYRIEILSSVHGVLAHFFYYLMSTLLYWSIFYYVMEKVVASSARVDISSNTGK